MTPERIEGEHHYAVYAPAYDPPSWLVIRGSDDVPVFACPDQGWAWKEVLKRDEQANHFIAQGEKQALERVDRAAEELDCFGATAYHDEDGSTIVWTVNAKDFAADRPTFTQAILSTEGA